MMIPYLQVKALKPNDIEKIHQSALTVLAKTGMLVEHPRLLEIFGDYGAEIDLENQKVYFPTALVEQFLSDTKPYPGDLAVVHGCDEHSPVVESECFRPINQSGKPYLATRAGISHGYYLDPANNLPTQFTEETLRDYLHLAQLLDEKIIVRMETYPVGTGRITQPLECRLFAWKHGGFEGGSIQMVELMPYLYDMYQVRADSLGLPIEQVFCASTYILSPLRMASDICEHILYFHDRGLKVRIGNMFSTGGTGPVTLAGCLTLGLAERIAIGILERCLYGQAYWVLYGEVSPLDMRTMLMPLGRPEMLLFNLAVIQLARHYGVPAHTLGGVSDAALPSSEAGMQKMMTALPCALAGGCNYDPGRLGVDTLYSPIQMILDAECISALRRVLRGFEIDADTLAVDLIEEVSAGGSFMATSHTVNYMRKELWQPTVWSEGGGYSANGSKLETDVDRAYQRWQDLMAGPRPEPKLSDQTEETLQHIINQAFEQLEN